MYDEIEVELIRNELVIYLKINQRLSHLFQEDFISSTYTKTIKVCLLL